MSELVKGPTALVRLLVLMFIPARDELSMPEEAVRRHSRDKYTGFLKYGFPYLGTDTARNASRVLAATWSPVLQCCYKARPKAAADKFAAGVSVQGVVSTSKPPSRSVTINKRKLKRSETI